MKDYNSVPKESFELNSGFIDIIKEKTLYVASKSDISSTLITYIKPSTSRSIGGVVKYEKDKELPIGPTAVIPSDNRFSFFMDKLPENKDITSIDVFLKTTDGYWAPIGQHLQQQVIMYDPSTRMLHLNKLNNALTTVFPLQGLSNILDGTPVIRLIITW